jgi:hypothetical protein
VSAAPPDEYSGWCLWLVETGAAETLCDRDMLIIKERLAGSTYRDIGKALGLSGNRVSQLHSRAMYRLRRDHGMTLGITDDIFTEDEARTVRQLTRDCYLRSWLQRHHYGPWPE